MSTQLTIKNKSLSISISLINKYDKGYFEIQSSDTQRDIQFYESVFGWKLIKEDFAPIEYYRIQTNSISGELLKRPAKVPPTESGTNAFVCSVHVENFDRAK